MSSSYYPPNHVFDNCVLRRQLGSSRVTRPFLSLQRVWLARLAKLKVTVTILGYEYYYLRPKSAAAKAATAVTVSTPLPQYARIIASGVAKVPQCAHLGYIDTNGSCNLRWVWYLIVICFSPVIIHIF